jgi:putative aldouronate transport system permease protein
MADFRTVTMKNTTRGLRNRMMDVTVIAITSVAVLLCLLPFINIISISLSTNAAVMAAKITLFPIGLSLDTYHAVLSDNTMIRSLLFTIEMTAVYTLFAMVLTIFAAYPLTKKRLRGRNFFLVLIVITMYFSGGIIPDYMLVKSLNLLDTMWALILPGMVSAYNLIILKTFFANIPESLEESAYLDGCTDVGILFKIVLPLSTPVLATLSLFYAVLRWNWFQDSLFYITDSHLYPLQLKLFQIVYNSMAVDVTGLEGGTANMFTPEGLKATCVVFATLPILIVYPWLQRYFVRGVMIGAIKG